MDSTKASIMIAVAIINIVILQVLTGSNLKLLRGKDTQVANC
jgi:hypothetical protein